MRMVHSTLEEKQEDNPNDSVVAQVRLNISPPEEYSGSSDVKVYETFVAGILRWLRLHGLLGVNTPKPKYNSWVHDSKATPVSGSQGT